VISGNKSTDYSSTPWKIGCVSSLSNRSNVGASEEPRPERFSDTDHAKTSKRSKIGAFRFEYQQTMVFPPEILPDVLIHRFSGHFPGWRATYV